MESGFIVPVIHVKYIIAIKLSSHGQLRLSGRKQFLIGPVFVLSWEIVTIYVNKKILMRSVLQNLTNIAGLCSQLTKELAISIKSNDLVNGLCTCRIIR